MGSEFIKRGMSTLANCAVCNNPSQMETLEHLFRDCPISARFWMGTDLGIRCDTNDDASIKDWIANWLSFFHKKKDNSDTINKFIATIWCLWCK